MTAAAIEGAVTAFFLFDIGDGIDLHRVRDDINDSIAARLSIRPTTPTYLQYQQPPLVVDGAVFDAAEAAGFRVRFKVFDYGVVSVALTRPLPTSWPETLTLGLTWQEDPALPSEAERLCRLFLDRVPGAVVRRRQTFLTEDYWVFVVSRGEDAAPAEDMLTAHGEMVAQLLRGEREPLSAKEREETLRHRLTYYASDTVVVTWSSALVIDTPSGASGVLEILEYANSQLLEFRYYDQRLDAELAKVYTGLQATGWRDTLLNRRYARAARQVHELFVDVNELTDKVENALKIAGDVYAARLFLLAAARLGLDQWKASVRDKLKTVDDIYRFAVEHSAMARGEFLELTIVLLIVLEILLALI